MVTLWINLTRQQDIVAWGVHFLCNNRADYIKTSVGSYFFFAMQSNTIFGVHDHSKLKPAPYAYTVRCVIQL